MKRKCSPRTLEKWRLGKVAPRAEYMTALLTITNLPPSSFLVNHADD